MRSHFTLTGLRLTTAAVFSFVAAVPALAQPDAPAVLDKTCSGAPTSFLALQSRAKPASNCLGEEADEKRVGIKIPPVKAEEKPSPAADSIGNTMKFAENMQSATASNLARIEEWVRAERKTLPRLPTEEQKGAEQALDRLVLSIVEAQRSVIDTSISDPKAIHQPGFWAYDGIQRKIYVRPEHPIDIGAVVRQECILAGAKEEPDCIPQYLNAEFVLRAAALTRRSLDVYTKDLQNEKWDDIARRDTQWNSYFNDAPLQYIWELGANAWLIDWKEGQKKREFEEDKKKTGSKIAYVAYVEPPTWQLTILHPSVALDYVGGADAGSRLKPAVILEVIGANWWGYNKTNKATDVRGISAIVSYADRAGTKSTGAGVLVRWDTKYSLAVTRYGNDEGIMLNIDLAQYIGEKNDRIKKFLKF